MNEEPGVSNQVTSLDQDGDISAVSPGIVDVGGALRRERESRGISIYEASMALKLSPKQVEALETNDWTQLPRTVTRGFVRNYARYLELDAGPLMAALDGTQMPRGPELKMAGGAPVNMPREGRGDRRDYARVVAGLVVLLLALLAYFFVPTETWQATLDSVKSAVMGSHQTTDNTAAPENTPEPTSETSPATHEASPMSASTAAQEGANSAAPVMPAATPLVVPAPAAASAPVSGAPSAAVSGAALSFSFTRPSWVEVRDRSGQVIFSQTNPADSHREVSGQPPFTLIVGNATYVTLQYKGKPVNLSPRSRDDVARLTLE